MAGARIVAKLICVAAERDLAIRSQAAADEDASDAGQRSEVAGLFIVKQFAIVPSRDDNSRYKGREPSA